MTIVISDACTINVPRSVNDIYSRWKVTPQFGASLINDSRIVIYDFNVYTAYWCSFRQSRASFLVKARRGKRKALDRTTSMETFNQEYSLVVTSQSVTNFNM
jgi:hypothetical protein